MSTAAASIPVNPPPVTAAKSLPVEKPEPAKAQEVPNRPSVGEYVAAFFLAFTIRQYLAGLVRIGGLAGLFVVYQTFEAEGLRELFSDLM